PLIPYSTPTRRSSDLLGCVANDSPYRGAPAAVAGHVELAAQQDRALVHTHRPHPLSPRPVARGQPAPVVPHRQLDLIAVAAQQQDRKSTRLTPVTVAS